MKDFGLVSIIMPCYNGACHIGEAIESVVNQTYENWQLLITDDCSTDDSVDLIKSYVQNDKRIKLFVLGKNQGAAVARNNSISKAKGRFIAFLDGDDFWLPAKLELQLDFMLKKKCAICCSSLLYSNENGEYIGIELAPKFHSFRDSLKDNKIGTTSAIYDTNMIGKYYMPLIRKRQDWALFMSILKTGVIAYGMKQPLCVYRIGHQSLSKNKWSLIKYNIATYQIVLKWSFPRALIYFLLVYMPHWLYKKWLIKQYNK